MHESNLSGLDLNLLTALRALLSEASVTEAAHSVGRTQSAMSHALSRLRHHFNDPLLVRDGWEMRLTPFAEALLPRALRAADAVDHVFSANTTFDPATSTRRLRIATRDICVPLFTPVVAALKDDAPYMSVEFLQPAGIRAAVLASEADLGLVFGSVAQDVSLTVRSLRPMTWAVFTPKDHVYAATPNAETWAAAHHIVVGAGNASKGPIGQAAEQAGLSRSILAAADSFTSALVMAAECGAVFTTLEEPFKPLAHRLGLVSCPLPFSMEPATTNLVMQEDFGDPFKRWLRQRLQTMT